RRRVTGTRPRHGGSDFLWEGGGVFCMPFAGTRRVFSSIGFSVYTPPVRRGVLFFYGRSRFLDESAYFLWTFFILGEQYV
ncbi:MAG: hypothetical protein Q4E18_08410, partial [Clostridia bacterium]|nr:hypothetical protein [Clostridia bacterium]